MRKDLFLILQISIIVSLIFLFSCELSELEKKTVTDSDAVSLDFDWINGDLLTYSSGDSSQDVNGNIQVPLKGKNRSTLNWSTSSNLIAINRSNGEIAVTCPIDNDTLVELEVSVTKGNEIKTKKITILIKKSKVIILSTQTVTATIGDFYSDTSITFSNGNEVKKGSNLEISITEVFDSYAWYIDGTLQSDKTTNSISIVTTNMDIKQYELMVKVDKSGNIYSKSIRFKIVSDL